MGVAKLKRTVPPSTSRNFAPAGVVLPPQRGKVQSVEFEMLADALTVVTPGTTTRLLADPNGKSSKVIGTLAPVAAMNAALAAAALTPGPLAPASKPL